jgi:hypothetical protein
MVVYVHILLVCLIPAAYMSSVTHESSEVPFVGKAVGAYVMLLGGGYYGQRLKIFRSVSFKLPLWSHL